MNRSRMNGSRWTLVALGAAAALAWSPAAIAQMQPTVVDSQPVMVAPVMVIDPSPLATPDFRTPDAGHVQSRVAMVEPSTTSTMTPMVATLQLEDGTRLTVPAARARVGDRVNANYAESGTGEKIVTLLHIEPEVQAP